MNLEICVDLLESAIIAQDGGADRIELCADLQLGGTTPSAGLMKAVRKHLKIDIYAMIRPRSGDFFYNAMEFETMKADVETAKALGMDGVVFGILDENGNIDKARMKELIELANPMNVTVHRAFDVSNDLFNSLDVLINLGVERILTSAGGLKVTDDLPLLTEIVRKADKRIKIMAGSGVTAENASEIIKTGVDELHLSAKSKYRSQMFFKKEISMGTSEEEFVEKTDLEKVRQLKKICDA
ncbi:MAG TPA: copper homeostasis protein CutC [Thermotogota bacterium]|nr:copper homeostasis protein CutC [Thermotogota bacterium]HPJ89368.1 copper homeostasis protein CutC [Thermotogota bacterium]HPR97106.1 copper homeostasis protein CutC [Thermotogota bacterium]